MKKFLVSLMAMLLVVSVCFSFTACGDDKNASAYEAVDIQLVLCEIKQNEDGEDIRVYKETISLSTAVEREIRLRDEMEDNSSLSIAQQKEIEDTVKQILIDMDIRRDASYEKGVVGFRRMITLAKDGKSGEFYTEYTEEKANSVTTVRREGARFTSEITGNTLVLTFSNSDTAHPDEIDVRVYNTTISDDKGYVYFNIDASPSFLENFPKSFENSTKCFETNIVYRLV